MNCTCFFCKWDRRKKRKQFIAEWRDGAGFYDRSWSDGTAKTTRDKATCFGPYHASGFGPAFRMIEFKPEVS